MVVAVELSGAAIASIRTVVSSEDIYGCPLPGRFGRRCGVGNAGVVGQDATGRSLWKSGASGGTAPKDAEILFWNPGDACDPPTHRSLWKNGKASKNSSVLSDGALETSRAKRPPLEHSTLGSPGPWGPVIRTLHLGICLLKAEVYGSQLTPELISMPAADARKSQMPEVFARYDIGPTGCSIPVPSGTLELSFHQNST